MAANQVTNLPGYPTKFGNKNFQVVELNGPTLYATGGQLISASQFGFGGFDHIACDCFSRSGTYYGRVQYLPIDATPSLPLGAARTANIVWYVTATNAEAGALDLSAEILRLSLLMV